ncbi:MFS transporter [Streptomyces sp. CB01201]|uniref:MFS transporter n=1 Tax=Streptomyces sp. CB01201 TaxID=2020324 RepID=UPI000C271804|nr:MFS transporter [Streptomyces sp. CB01201]PJM98560.1 MFS transporter [Streptomyces sp. CB01201]
MTAPVQRQIALLVSVVGAVIVALDGTILLMAQPGMQRDLGASVAQIQWTSTGYLVAVAALLVIAGRLGDRYGHPRLLFVGVLGFGAASAGIALAPTVGWVIVLRAVQGGFAAFLQPATLALLRLAYPADRLSKPIAIRTSAIAVAAGSGPLLGGVLVAHLGWRAAFWGNVPLAFVIAVLALAVRTPAPQHAISPRLNLTSAGLLAVALAILVHALADVPARGWTAAPTLLEFLAVIGVATVLGWHERRTTHPIVPPAVAGSVPVTASMAILLITTAGLFGALFRATFYLQDVLRLDPLDSGLRVLPLTVLMVLGSPAAVAALRRYGARRTAIAGTVLVVVGIAGLSRLGPASTWMAMAVAFAAVGAGFAIVMVTATGTVVGDAPPGCAGVVSGLKQTAMNIGPIFGIAVAASATGTAASTMNSTLLILAALAALGLLPASRLPRRPAHQEGGATTAAPPVQAPTPQAAPARHTNS